ncbi:hypothetical protein [Streptomyces sp. CPS1]
MHRPEPSPEPSPPPSQCGTAGEAATIEYTHAAHGPPGATEDPEVAEAVQCHVLTQLPRLRSHPAWSAP